MIVQEQKDWRRCKKKKTGDDVGTKRLVTGQELKGHETETMQQKSKRLRKQIGRIMPGMLLKLTVEEYQLAQINSS